MKYYERRTLSDYNLRNLCIKKNWYTLGTNEEYMNLFSKLSDNFLSAEMTTEKLTEIALDIMKHSSEEDCRDGYLEMVDIMYDLAKACDTAFFEH